MDPGFELFPDQASSVAKQVDGIYFLLLAVSAFFTVAIFLAIVFLALYYRRGTGRHQIAGHSRRSWMLEVTWIIIPFVITMVIFFWGAIVYLDVSEMPEDAIEMQVVGKQWMWKIQHPEGRREINELHIPVGQPVRLRMISEDVIHSFYIPEFRAKQDVLPGRYSTMWFEATHTGVFHLLCAEYCGTDHADMIGKVVVQTPAEYAAWLAGSSDQPPQASGAELFTRYRCNTCHHDGADARGPNLAGVYGKSVPVGPSGQVTADESYLRQSIREPTAHIHTGYQPVMPAYQSLSEEEVYQLIEYIKALGAEGTE